MRNFFVNHKRISGTRRGFSLAELSIVMFLTTLITGVLVVFYAQSRLVLERGVSKTELEQKTRIAATRVIPKITSVIRRPPDPRNPNPALQAEIPPIVSPVPSTYPNPALDPGVSLIELNTTKEFIKTQLRLPVTPADMFNPRGLPAAQHGVLQLRFVVTGTSTVDPRLGNVGELRMNARAPDGIAKDIVVARGLNLVSFMVYQDNRRVRLRIRSKGLVKNATSGTSVGESNYETDIYLPVYTNSSGGGSTP